MNNILKISLICLSLALGTDMAYGRIFWFFGKKKSSKNGKGYSAECEEKINAMKNSYANIIAAQKFSEKAYDEKFIYSPDGEEKFSKRGLRITMNILNSNATTYQNNPLNFTNLVKYNSADNCWEVVDWFYNEHLKKKEKQ